MKCLKIGGGLEQLLQIAWEWEARSTTLGTGGGSILPARPMGIPSHQSQMMVDDELIQQRKQDSKAPQTMNSLTEEFFPWNTPSRIEPFLLYLARELVRVGAWKPPVVWVDPTIFSNEERKEMKTQIDMLQGKYTRIICILSSTQLIILIRLLN